MGFFSKTCAKTHLPVVADCINYPKLHTVVVLYPDGRKVEGSYDGYGRIDGMDLCPNGYDHDLWERLKFVSPRHTKARVITILGSRITRWHKDSLWIKSF